MIIPAENERDLKEIPENVKENLTIHPVKWMDDVLEIALERMPEPRLEEEEPSTEKPISEVASQDGELPINPH